MIGPPRRVEPEPEVPLGCLMTLILVVAALPPLAEWARQRDKAQWQELANRYYRPSSDQ